jgi:NitT/TauT family transport system ATP-binding protein
MAKLPCPGPLGLVGVAGSARELPLTLLRLTGVGKVFRTMQGSDYVAVRDFDLDIEAGEFFCLLGTSGCGKTTILNMIAGFEPATSGSVEIAGQAIESPGADRGVVFQGDDSLYPWLSALGNVEFGLRMRGLPRAERLERAHRYLDLVGLKDQDHKHPAELSGGMKQRIQIARVLANEPQVLLMDEPHPRPLRCRLPPGARLDPRRGRHRHAALAIVGNGCTAPLSGLQAMSSASAACSRFGTSPPSIFSTRCCSRHRDA